MAKKNPRIVHIVTVAQSVRFVTGELAYLDERGFEAHVITSDAREKTQEIVGKHATAWQVRMEREMSPMRDARSLWSMYRRLRLLKPDIVVASTPKAGLLGMVASRLARVPNRVYLQRGLRFETSQGMTRYIVRLAERIACRCSSVVICVSNSVRERLVTERLVRPERAIVVASGSSHGVDASSFDATPERLAQASRIRAQYGIPENAHVLGFVGRLVKDKGVMELAEAFKMLQEQFADVWLVLVGDWESGDPVPPQYVSWLRSNPRVVITGFIADVSAYYHVMDLLVFPSLREGFPNAPLEAAAAGKPVVGFNVTGTVDAIRHGVTGKLVAVAVPELAKAIGEYLTNHEMRCRHGQSGRDVVGREYVPERVWTALTSEYVRLLAGDIPASTLP